MKKKVLIVNGPNLNMLGQREPIHYGHMNLDEIIRYTENKLCDESVELTWWQSNSESAIIEKIQEASGADFAGIIINPAGYSHTSVAILDALKILRVPIVEVHLSNVYQRESFRHCLLTAQASSIIMSGLGKNAYLYGVKALEEEWKKEAK